MVLTLWLIMYARIRNDKVERLAAFLNANYERRFGIFAKEICNTQSSENSKTISFHLVADLIDGSVQDCSISANPLDIRQSCIKPFAMIARCLIQRTIKSACVLVFYVFFFVFYFTGGLVPGKFIHIFQGRITGLETIIWLPQCQWSNREEYEN